MRVLAAILFAVLAGCGPDLLLPLPDCCEDDRPLLVPARNMDDARLLAILERPDRSDLTDCWREAERRRLVRFVPSRNGSPPRVVHDANVSDAVAERYLAFKQRSTPP